MRFGCRVPVCALVCLVFVVVSPARASQWPDQYQTGQFLCHADFSLVRYRGFLDTLPRLQNDLVEMLGIIPSGEPIHLFLFQHKNTYQAYVKHHFPDVPSRKALFIKGRGPGMVFAYLCQNFEIDLRHECTHALLNASLPMVPLWLDEGLAEYFELPTEQRARRNPHGTMVTWGARLGQVPRLPSLEGIGDLQQMTHSKYRHAWAWVHFMLHSSPETRAELSEFLKDIQNLTPPGQLSRRLQQRVGDVDQAFVHHFGKWR